ncbi:demethylmenaquinone methyltransferase [Brevibacterium paucivorans]|uniref:Demethylmenaquinone methyltransferase n=2 Tax=Brevibacterium TaxID=1696 RepID=A0A2N6VMX7_9MICO|nr:demethylmenaquinone methyltransferase [Brevibacterium paucivorans]PMD05474.1 demethylmenaquinone methyltransferase [Brevibacterium paucivorans]
MSRAHLDKQKSDVASMFDAVAQRYDLTNDAMTFGLSRWWRVENTRSVDPRPGEKILDLAAGTGSSSVPYAQAGAHVIAGDISEGMLEVGRKRHPDIEFVYADALDLPFDDNEFDAVTITYGFRNVQDPARALAQMLRVLKPGGRLIITEFSTPTFAPFSKFYKQYIMRALPAVAKVVSSNPEAYVYLAESIREWPAQLDLSYMIRDAGFDQVKYRNLTGGIVAIHHAIKPGAIQPGGQS